MVFQPTIEQARRAACNQLHTVSDTAQLDADILIAESLFMERSILPLMGHVFLDAAQQTRLASLLARRMNGEPIAYITCSKEFWSLDFIVNPAVLVPRPETELVVERALAHCRERPSPLIADLGTGCGAIALALASELKQSRVIATDVSTEALSVARQNCEQLKLADAVEFVEGHWTRGLPDLAYDLIVSNPPYIAQSDPCLDDPLMQHEPRLALVGGVDGLGAIREIVDSAKPSLKAGGWLIVEHGYDQGEAVRELMDKENLIRVETFHDLAGLPRVTEGQA